MLTITARQEFAGVIAASRRAPVRIRNQQQDVAVVMSMEEYERLVRRNVAEFQRACDRIGETAMAAGMNADVLRGLLDNAD